MAKLIDYYQEDLIVCDNINCNYKIQNLSGYPHEETKQYINQPCPCCGHNLLTQEDYDKSFKVLKLIDTINKWFGWLSFFSRNKSKQQLNVHVHNGVKISKIE